MEAVLHTAQPVQISSRALIKAYFRIEDEKCKREFQKMKLLYKKKAYFRIEDKSKLKHEKKCQKTELLNEKKIKDVLEDRRWLQYLEAGMKAIITWALLSYLNNMRYMTYISCINNLNNMQTLPLLDSIILGVEFCGFYLVGRDLYQIENSGHVSRDCPSGGDRDREDDRKCYHCQCRSQQILP